jgi:hypothetical protein
VPEGRIKFCDGSKYTGKISLYVTQDGTRLLAYKNWCGNPLNEIEVGLREEDLPSEDKEENLSLEKQKGKVYHIDTKNQQVYVHDTVFISSETNNFYYYSI